MGRKSIPRERKINHEKMGDWTHKLFPYFQKHGLNHVTMDEVSVFLGKSKTTLYDYFRTKEDMLALLINERMDIIRQFKEPLNDERYDFKTRYQNTVMFLSTHIADISNLFLKDLQKLFPTLWETVMAFLDESAIILKDFYAKGIKAGQFNNINGGVLVLTDHLFFHALTNADILEQQKLTMETAFVEYLKLRFDGLLK